MNQLRSNVSHLAMTTLMHIHRVEAAKSKSDYNDHMRAVQESRYEAIFMGEPYQPVFG